MSSLQDLLGAQQGMTLCRSHVTSEQILGRKLGYQAALPMILGSLANNARHSRGAESLNTSVLSRITMQHFENLGGLGSMILADSNRLHHLTI